MHGAGEEVEAAELISGRFALVSLLTRELPVSGLGGASVGLCSPLPTGCAVLRGGGVTLRDNFNNRLSSSFMSYSATARDEKELGRLP